MWFLRILAVVLFSEVTVNAMEPRLDGAFVQFDGDNREWETQQWQAMLGRMRDAKCNFVILQYLEKRNACSDLVTSESYLPQFAEDKDPVKLILDEAEKHGMTVFIGLRFDEELMGSEFLAKPKELSQRLDDELPRNIGLAKKVTSDYRLKDKKCFGGWYLPVEIANYRDDFLQNETGWVQQLNRFTKKLVAECKCVVTKPVAVSPYFTGHFNDCRGRSDLVAPDIFGKNYTAYLKGTGINIVMLQDNVGVSRIHANDVERYVRPYHLSLHDACGAASAPGHKIEFWLNVESIGADIGRLKKQLAVGRDDATKIVTFDFPHHLDRQPLYDEYIEYLKSIK